MKRHFSWGNLPQLLHLGYSRLDPYSLSISSFEWIVVSLLLLASLPRTGSLPLSFSWDEGLQPGRPRPPALKLCLQIAKCLNTIFFPINSITSRWNLQFSLWGQMHKSKLCPSFVDSFKKLVLLLAQGHADCGSAIECVYTIQCLISLPLHESSGEYSAFLQMASSSACVLQPISSLLCCFHKGNNLISAKVDPSALLSCSATICWISLIKGLVPYQNSQLVTS